MKSFLCVSVVDIDFLRLVILILYHRMTGATKNNFIYYYIQRSHPQNTGVGTEPHPLP
jgi:hypothetical protein